MGRNGIPLRSAGGIGVPNNENKVFVATDLTVSVSVSVFCVAMTLAVSVSVSVFAWSSVSVSVSVFGSKFVSLARKFSASSVEKSTIIAELKTCIA